jgi:hypothetical protein
MRALALAKRFFVFISKFSAPRPASFFFGSNSATARAVAELLVGDADG